MGTGVIRGMGVGRRTKRSAHEWRALLGAHKRSGETRRGFCARHGIALSTFDWWRRRVHAEDGGVAPASHGEPGASALFVELSAPSQIRSEPATSAWDVELELGAGVVLRLRRRATPC